MPPYRSHNGSESNVTAFIDDYEVGKIPGIGSKLAQKLRNLVLGRAARIDTGLVYGGTKEAVTVRDVRLHPDANPEKFEILLGGLGSPRGIGLKVWQLLHGVDDTEVSLARGVPRQISIEDSYIRLDTLPEVTKELNVLSRSLITRMRMDLLGDEGDNEPPETAENLDGSMALKNDSVGKRWLAHPRTIRLSTRPRAPLNPDGTRTRSFKRISHSAPLPRHVFNTTGAIDALADKLVQETLIPMFRRLHPEKAGWNLSLVNVAVTNMAETAGESKTAKGRDIGNMFRKQEDVLKDFRVVDEEWLPPVKGNNIETPLATEQMPSEKTESVDLLTDGDDYEEQWAEGNTGNDENGTDPRCEVCGASVPLFASAAHSRFHSLGD